MGRGIRTLGIAATAGVAAAGAAAIATAKGFADTAGELDDFSRKVGLSVEDIQTWRYAMKLSGVDTETFNGGLVSFNRLMGQARTGTGKLATGLKKAGEGGLLKALQATKNNDEALRLYLAAMEQVPDTGRRAALGTLGFAGAGSEMALAAAAGADEIARLRAEKVRDGVISTEAAAKGAELGDQLDRLDSKYQALKGTIGGVLGSALEPHIIALADWAGANKEIIGQNVAGAVDTVAGALRSIDWDAIGSGIRTVSDLFGGLAEVARDAAEAVRLIPREVNNMPWAESGADAIAAVAGDNQPGGERGNFVEQLIRNMAETGQISEAQAQQAARGMLGFGLTNVVAPGASPDFVRAARAAGTWQPNRGEGGILGAGAVKERPVGASALGQQLGALAAKGGTVEVKITTDPGTKAEVVKDTTPKSAAPVKVETGRRSVGGRL